MYTNVAIIEGGGGIPAYSSHTCKSILSIQRADSVKNDTSLVRTWRYVVGSFLCGFKRYNYKKKKRKKLQTSSRTWFNMRVDSEFSKIRLLDEKSSLSVQRSVRFLSFYFWILVTREPIFSKLRDNWVVHKRGDLLFSKCVWKKYLFKKAVTFSNDLSRAALLVEADWRFINQHAQEKSFARGNQMHTHFTLRLSVVHHTR